MLGDEFVFGDVDDELGFREFFQKVFGSHAGHDFGSRGGQTLTINDNSTGTVLVIHSLKETA